MKGINVGSLIRLGPEDWICWEGENGWNQLYLEDYEHVIVTAVHPGSAEYEVLLGNEVYLVKDQAAVAMMEYC